jgi:hypothetical protein
MDVQRRFAIFAGGEHAHSHHLMGSINGQEHRLRRHSLRTPRADDNITTSNPTNQDSLSHRHPLLLGKTLDTLGHHIPIL